MRPTDRLPWTSPLAIISLLVGVAIFVIGARFVLAPLAGAEGFGIAVPHTAADPYLVTKGVRDMASGIIVFCLVAAATRRVVGIYMLAASFIPCGDFLTVVSRIGPQPTPMMIHGGTALVLWILSYFLIRGTAVSSAQVPQPVQPGAR